MRRWRLILLVFLFVVIGCRVHPESRLVRPVSSDWTGLLIETRAGVPTESDIPAEGWVDALDFARLDGRFDYWGRTSLPESEGEPPSALIFRGFSERIALFVDGDRIYTFEAPDEGWRRPGSLRFHVVPLPEDWSGSEMHVWIGQPPRTKWRSGYLVVTERALPDLLTGFVIDPVRRGWLSVSFGIAFAFLGLFVVAVAAARTKRVDAMLAALGSFTLLYGLREVLRGFLPVLLGAPPVLVDRIESTLNHLINVPAWLFFLFLVGPGWRRSLELVVWVMSAFAVIGPVADAVTGRAFTLGEVNNVLVLAALAVALTNIWFGRRRLLGRELRLLLAGVLVLAVFSLYDNLAGLGVVRGVPGLEIIGFAFFVVCLAALAAARFFDRERQLATIGLELETARKIQESILPPGPPSVAGLEVAARYVSMSEVAGDYYDYLVDADGRLTAIVADVSGHGVPAALVASMVKVAVAGERGLEHGPDAMLAGVNQALGERLQHAFVTAVVAAIDVERDTVAVSCAGHPPALVRRRDGSVEEVGAPGLVLGRLGSRRYGVAEAPFGPGESLLLFTDGVFEAVSSAGEPFGEDRLRAAFGQAGGHPDEVADRLVAEVRAHAGRRGDESLDDDITLVVIARSDSSPG